MAVLGKRKSRDGEPSDGVSDLDAEVIFRRHFEAQFEPLDDEALPRGQDDDDTEDSDLGGGGHNDREGEDSDEDDGDEWGGFSDDEDGEDEEDSDEDEDEAPAVQVIDHSKPQVPKEPKMSKKELKAFMSSKVIDHTAPQTTTSSSSSSKASSAKALPEDAPSLLAQDLELRRLLAESHLLTPSHNNAASASVFASPSASAEPKTFAGGRTRLKATDLRMRALGSKTSVLTQEKMPMGMRKGIVAAAGAREEKRRREARENGIILERSAQGKGKRGNSRGRQERGVHGPGIGRMRGAELRISEGDVRKIEGGRDAFGRRGRR